ncbi:DUF6197 family protein, partial [Luedemannella helvata]|uniref:DUF6197 family protein n=1 Tax=Luedemannella helvata TaxID=349315 RepID=UPI003CD078AA
RMSALDVTVEFTETVRYFADFLVLNHGVALPTDLAGLAFDEEIVSGWNDDPGRWASDVIVALRGAAEEWERIRGGAA